MHLLERLSRGCARLWRDETGVVLAFTVVVFLTLFVMACSVYAVGEHIRRRIELQNAADAAAYSAAVVQADALSRVAAINRAMAWTYVQLGRDMMSYDQDSWLATTLNQFQADYATCLGQIAGFSTCPQTYLRSWIGQSGQPNCALFPDCATNGEVLINIANTNLSYSVSDLSNLGDPSPGNLQALQTRIQGEQADLTNLNAEETSVVAALPGYIRNTVSAVLQLDCASLHEQDFTYSLICSPATQYFTTLTNEDILLQFFDQPGTAATLFAPGINQWFNLGPSGNGIQREYVQQPDCLRADWNWHLEGWINTPSGPKLAPGFPVTNSDTVLGNVGQTLPGQIRYYQTGTLKPQILTDAYFQSAGIIVVGVARRSENPFSWMGFDAATAGLFGFFSPTTDSAGNPSYAWACAAARAGYQDTSAQPGAPAAPSAGQYNTKAPPGWIATAANLSLVDWDAELVPVQWGAGPNQEPVLQYLWNSAPWQALFPGGPSGSGLPSLASGNAPTGAILH